MSRPEKQTPSAMALRRMLSKHSGEHGEKCTTYGAAIIMIVLVALLPAWSGVLWLVSGAVLVLMPFACIILALVVGRALFHYIVERLPGVDGAGR